MGALSGGMSLGTLVVEIVAQVDEALGSIKKFGDDVSGVLEEQKKKWEGLGEVGQSLTGIGAGLTMLTVPFVALSGASVKAAGELEALRNALTTVTGSSEETAKQMERLKEIAKLPGLGLEEAVKGSLALQNIGMSAQEAERYLKAFGNAIAAAGGGKADLAAVVVQLRQMGSTGKVAAEDLKPILERVPQVAAVTKEAFGTIDTEQLSKAGISSQKFLETIVAGLEKIPPVTGGIKNAMENMGDSAQAALAKIGNAFVPVLNAVSPLIEKFLTMVGDLATWFQNLPGPVQAFVGTLAGLAAALGPILLIAGQMATALAALAPAITAVAEVLGVSALALGGWAVAIGVAVAALVALGVWVYQNWDAIVAVLTQAWDGLKEIWNAFATWVAGWFAPIWNGLVKIWHTIMDPYFAFLAAVWGPVIQVIEAAWNGISGFLSDVWKGIKTTAETVWGAISSAIKTFISWAEKIPGVNKLFNLDDAWKSAQKLSEQTKNAGDAAKTATPKVQGMAGAMKAGVKPAQDAAAATEEFHHATRDFIPPAKSFGDVLDDLYAKKLPPMSQQLEILKQKAEASRQKIDELSPPIVSMGKYVAENFQPAMKEAAAAIATLGTNSSVTKPDIVVLEEALKSLGVTSAAKFSQMTADASAAYNTVVSSGLATQWEKDSAFLKLLQAEEDAMKANGYDIPEYHKKMLADMKAATEDKGSGLPATVGLFEQFGNQVSTVITNFAQDAAKSLWEGGTSWGEKGKNLLKSLGEAVTSSFIEPAAKAITGFVEGAIKDLLSGKGLGGVMDSLKSIGSAVGGLFGGGKSAADVAGGAADAAGGAADAVGGGASAAAGAVGSSITGIVGAVAGVVSAISSVIGNFQMAKMETTLNAIEHSTRYSELYLGSRGDGGILGILFRIDEEIAWGAQTKALENFRDLFKDWSPWVLTDLDLIKDHTNDGTALLQSLYDATLAAGTAQGALFDKLVAAVEQLVGIEQQNVTYNLNGTDPSLVAANIGRRMRLQGAFA